MDEQPAISPASPVVTPSVVEPSPLPPPARKSNWRLFIFGGLTVVGIGVIAAGMLIWRAIRQVSTDPTVVAVAQVLRLPVAKINGLPVTYADYVTDLAAIKKFYAKAPAGYPSFAAEQLSDQVLSRLLANQLVAQIARQYNVSVTEADLASTKADLLKPYATKEAAEKELFDRYGWTLDGYMDKVVRPYLLEQKLQQAFTASATADTKKYAEDQVKASHILVAVSDKKPDAQALRAAQLILRRVTTGKEDFAKVAGEASDDPGTKATGGDLGWFGPGAMVKEFEQAAFLLAPGQISPAPVKTSFGYHVIKVVDKRTVRNFSKFIQDQLLTAKIEIDLPIHNPFATLKKSAASPSGTTTATSTK